MEVDYNTSYTHQNLQPKRNLKSLHLLCLCRRSHVGVAASVFNSMKGKVSFNVDTYNVVVGGWSKLGRVNEIERVMKEMEVEGFSPDFSTFTFFLEGLGSMKEKDTATYNAGGTSVPLSLVPLMPLVHF